MSNIVLSTVEGTVLDIPVKEGSSVIEANNFNEGSTIASVAGHSMYERETPYYEHTLGGTLDMRDCRYEQFDERTARITGARWVPAKELRVKIEGAKKIGERYMGFVGLRDPHVVRNVDAAIEWCKSAVAKRFGSDPYELYFHVFGRNGVLKELEPTQDEWMERCRNWLQSMGWIGK